MAATAQTEIQELLRFLTKEARLSLAEAIPKIQLLRNVSLHTPESISHAQHADLKVIFTDEKVLKQVVSAAKRVSNPNKRSPAKRAAREAHHAMASDTNDEASLTLPTTNKSEQELHDVQVETNRAPLFLAFALVVLKHTYPEQPLSSRLSLAQAVVSAGAQSKARYIGLTMSPTAEEDGWAQGQPKVRIMGREVAAMRRHMPTTASAYEEQHTAKVQPQESSHQAFWGIDLEALRKSNGPLTASASASAKDRKAQSGPPVHTPQSARQYLLKSMTTVGRSDIAADQKSYKAKKPTTAEMLAMKEETAGLVLEAINILCESWKDTLTTEELDRRAQTWYASVRPEVAQGRAGWGQRGLLKLSDILKLKRMP